MTTKPQIVTSYRREMISQNPETSLGSYLDENSSTAVCFAVSPQSNFVVGDSHGNIIVGQKINRVVEFQQINVFGETFLAVYADSAQYICIGREKGVKEITIKLVETKNKKLIVKQTQAIEGIEDFSCASLSQCGQFLAIGDNVGNITLLKFPKLKTHLRFQLKQKEKVIPVLNVSFYQYDASNSLRPTDFAQKKGAPQQQQPSITRTMIVCGSTSNQSHTEAALVCFNLTNANDFQSINMSNIFTMSPFLQQSYITFTDNKLCYLTTNSAKAGQSIIESIMIHDGKQITTPNDVKNVEHIVKQTICGNVILKDCNSVQQLAAFRANEFMLVTDAFLQIFTVKNRVNYFATDYSQQYIINFDAQHQSYIMLQTNPNNVQLVEIQQIEAEQLIDSLLGAKLYEEAVALALDQRSRCKQYKQAAVRQIYAQQLFELGRYEEACAQYIETINTLEPSVVVRAFLEHGRTQELTNYLEALHANKTAASSHTNLLMNCYVKNNDINRLIKFIRAAEDVFVKLNEQPVFNVQLACQNLIQSKLDDLAVEIAICLDCEIYAAQLLLQRGRADELLQLLPTLVAPKAAEIIIQYGNDLMASGTAALEAVTQIIQQLCLTYKPIGYEALEKFLQAKITTELEGQAVSSDLGQKLSNKYHYVHIVKNKTQKVEPVLCNNRVDEFVHLFVERKYEIQLVKIIGNLIAQKLNNAEVIEEQSITTQSSDKQDASKKKSLFPVIGAKTTAQPQQTQQQPQQSQPAYDSLHLSEICLETYFELLLKQQQYRLGKYQPETAEAAQIPFIAEIDDEFILVTLRRVVEESNFKVSLDHLLILFQTYDCRRCIIYALQALKMQQECIKFYAQNNQFGEAVELYRQADNDTKQQLYADLLQLACQQSTPELIDSSIKQVLKVFEADKTQSINCLNIVELLTQFNSQLELATVYDYLKNQLQIIDEQTIQSYQNYSNSLKTIEATKKQIEAMRKPKHFSKQQNCFKCNLQIEAPCVYVRCGHVYHEKCWKSTLQQCSCWRQDAEDASHRVEYEVESYKTFADVLGGFVGNQYLGQQQTTSK